MLRMDEINKIKNAHHVGESVNEIAERFGRSWATVNNIVKTPEREVLAGIDAVRHVR
jgi:transposase